MKAARPTGEREALERLRADESALEREIAFARAEAASAIAAARADAELARAEARLAAEREGERLRNEVAEEIDRAACASASAVEAEREALRRRAGTRWERAIVHALRAVLGGDG